MIGTKIAHYEIVGKLGEGGMGVVYRARDLKLNREVAIKVLPEQLAADVQRMERFRREAQLLAQLNHASVAGIYGVEESNGRYALVMELAEGPTLADRLASGPVPIEECLPIAHQIAEALEAAHQKGIIHRDLKPANIKISDDGKVKVLDFGLAKALEGDPTSRAESEHSPTLTLAATQAGIILGTAAYMSPEQARGRKVDKRTDIWAFGVLLYEMLTGRQIFGGETISDSLASVLRAEIDLDVLPAETPPSVRRLLRRCLERDRRSRLRDIGDALLELEETPTADGTAAISVPASAVRRPLPWVLFMAAALGFLAVALIHFRESSPERPLRRFAITPQEFNRPSEHVPVISPNGKHIAYIAGVPGRADAESVLWIRDLDQDSPRMVDGSDGARKPFWSPASDFVGFIQQGNLRKVPVEGEPIITVCGLPESSGYNLFFDGTWSPDGASIVFSALNPTRLFEVDASGGTLSPLQEAPAESDGSMHHSPAFLPLEAGPRILMFAIGKRMYSGEMVVRNLETGEQKSLEVQGGLPKYSPTGHIVYQSDAGVPGAFLWAFPFSLESLKVTANPFPVTENASWASIASDGTLVYRQEGSAVRERLVWKNRLGVNLADINRAWPVILHPALSPDGHKLMVAAGENGLSEIFVYDLTRSLWNRVTNNSAYDIRAVWSPTGDRIAFMTDRGGAYDIFLRAADGSGDATPLVTHDDIEAVSDWSSDGRNLIFYRIDPRTQRDLWRLEWRDGGDLNEEHPILKTDHNEKSGSLSPDGRWLAYVSDRTGRDEVYVRDFPEGDREERVSINGGNQPRWSRDGTELFYVERETLVAVAITTEPALSVGEAKKLFSDPGLPHRIPGTRRYDVHPDGKRFIVVTPDAEAGESPASIRVVENWYEEFRGRR